VVETEAFTSLFQTTSSIATLVFVLASTFSAGLSLTFRQILDPLHNTKLVLLALVANFILVPALALILLYVFSLPQPLAIGLFILSTVAGAPFVLKLTQAAKRRYCSCIRADDTPDGCNNLLFACSSPDIFPWNRNQCPGSYKIYG